MTNIELKAQVTETEDIVYIDGIPPMRFGESQNKLFFVFYLCFSYPLS